MAHKKMKHLQYNNREAKSMSSRNTPELPMESNLEKFCGLWKGTEIFNFSSYRIIYLENPNESMAKLLGTMR